MTQKADVVICGAGVIGASVAYHLALRGIRSTVVEREQPAWAASGKAAGLLTPTAHGGEDAALAPLIARSLERHHELARDLDGPARYDFGGLDAALVATTEKEARALRTTHPTETATDKLGAAGGWLDRPFSAAASIPGCAQLDAAKLTTTLLDVAAEHGSQVIHGDVQGVRTENSRVTGVLVSAETIDTPCVVAAMGPWSAEAEAWLRMPIPVRPLKGQILKFRIPGAPKGLVAGLDGSYAVRKRDGIVLTGTTEEDIGFDLTPSVEARKAIQLWARARSRHFEDVEPFEHTACLRPISEDGLPLIGPSPVFEGAYVATGHGRKGVLLSAATGEALADLITTGRCATLDLAPFDPGRFRTIPKGM